MNAQEGREQRQLGGQICYSAHQGRVTLDKAMSGIGADRSSVPKELPRSV